MPYCTPWNAGLDSEPNAVCRRLAKLITTLDEQINSNIVSGEILDDIRAFRLQLQDKLEKEGWTYHWDHRNKLFFRQPGHPKPFPKH